MTDDPNEVRLERYQAAYYSAGDTAQQLGVSVNMLRRYAKALEALQGKEAVHIDPQRGRQYTQDQLDILKAARDYVSVNRGSSVEDALRAALGMDGVVVRSPTPAPSEMALREAVEVAVRVALTEVVAPLEREIDGLRRQIERLSTSEDEVRRLRRHVDDLEGRNAALLDNHKPDQPAPQPDSGDGQPGALVRAATRFERLWRAVSGRQ